MIDLVVNLIVGIISFAIGAISARKIACAEFQEELDRHASSGRCSYYERQK